MQFEIAHKVPGLESKVKGRKVDLKDIGTTVKQFKLKIHRNIK